MLIATAILWPLVDGDHSQMMKADGRYRDLHGRWGVLKLQWERRVACAAACGSGCGDFMPGFHPWDHDNREFLAGIETIARDFDAALAACVARKPTPRTARAADGRRNRYVGADGRT